MPPLMILWRPIWAEGAQATMKNENNEDLAQEARIWEERKLTPSGWEDSPEAVPRAGESVLISIRLPRQMIVILREFAKRAGVGYEVLVRQWLDDRIRQESCLRRRSSQ